MTARTALTARRAFTLVEILIVVIILGILAAIVIPTFANASEDARRTNMRNQLQTLRGTVELYRVEHRDVVPLLITDGWDVVTNTTTIDGAVDPDGGWGPYLPEPPVNPLTNSSTVVPVGSAADATNGWFYDEVTGAFHGANRSGAMSDTGE
jgi:general secretion pathway protein G